MSLPITKFPTNDTAARAVLGHINMTRPTSQQLHARPFNHYEPEFSRWWLTPGSDWPAYPHSKLSIRKSPTSPGEMYVGFYTEKGLDKSLARISEVQPTYIMQDDWYWHQFLREAREGVLDPVAEEVVRRSDCTMRLLIEIYAFNSIPCPGAAIRPDEFVQLKRVPSASSYEPEIPGGKVLAPFNSCSSVKDVAECVQTESGLRFFWVDLHIGIHLAYGSETSGTWGAAEIWQNALVPWSLWVK